MDACRSVAQLLTDAQPGARGGAAADVRGAILALRRLASMVPLSGGSTSEALSGADDGPPGSPLPPEAMPSGVLSGVMFPPGFGAGLVRRLGLRGALGRTRGALAAAGRLARRAAQQSRRITPEVRRGLGMVLGIVAVALGVRAGVSVLGMSPTTLLIGGIAVLLLLKKG